MSYHYSSSSSSSSSSSQNKVNAQGQTAPAGYHYMPDGTLMADEDMMAAGSPMNSTTSFTPMVHKWVRCDPQVLPQGMHTVSSTPDELEIELHDGSPIPSLQHPLSAYAGVIHWTNTFYNYVGQPSVGDVVRVTGQKLQGSEIVFAHENYPHFIEFRDYYGDTTPSCYIYKGLGQKYPAPGNPDPVTGVIPNTQYWAFRFGYNIDAFQSRQFANCTECWNNEPTTILPSLFVRELNIDDTSFHPKGEIRDFSITGDPGAVFTLIIRNETPHYYNFKTRSFQSSQTADTKIHHQAIPKSGVYKNKVFIPSISDDDHYVFQIYAESHFNTDIALSESLLYEKTIYQYDEVSVTFKPDSKGFDVRFKAMPADLVVTRAPLRAVNSGNPIETGVSASADISWTFESNPTGTDTFALKEIRQPLETDYEIYQTGITVDGAITSPTTSIVLNSLGNLFEGMYFTGTGVDLDSGGDAPTILSIDTDTKTITVSTAQNGISDGAGLLFWGGGKNNIEQFSDIRVSFSDISLKIEPLTVKVDGATSSSRDITLEDAGGIRIDSDMEIEGIGFDNTTTQRSTAINYSTKVMQVTSNQTLEDDAILKIKGIGKTATVTTKATINRMPSSDLIIQFNVDAILTAATS